MAKTLHTNLTFDMIERIRKDFDLQVAMDEWVKWNLNHPNESCFMKDWLNEKEKELNNYYRKEE